MRIHVLAFARLREILGSGERCLELPVGARASDAWQLLCHEHERLESERASTRVARNGRMVSFDEALRDGDELALLPPVGGG
ncbi:MAG: MoaD/ThiS family protein [Candidatus Eremiobacteraeota bacterium]|nr:MoaD/ThiS family protein [Candidatus Eremiobacteraeota bacterium]